MSGYVTTHSVRLDNTGKTYPFHLVQELCGSPILPEGGSEELTHMNNSLGAYGRLQVIVTLLENGRRFTGETRTLD